MHAAIESFEEKSKNQSKSERNVGCATWEIKEKQKRRGQEEGKGEKRRREGRRKFPLITEATIENRKYAGSRCRKEHRWLHTQL